MTTRTAGAGPVASLVRWLDSWAVDERDADRDPREIDWLRVVPFIAIHAGCLLVLVVGWSWTAALVAAGFYAVRMFAITAFYHRYFSHRAFRTSRPVQFAFALLGATAIQRGPLWWASHHRAHHRHSDRDEDVHSPDRHGFWWSHVGWVLAQGNFHTRLELVRDLAKFPELRFLDRFDALVPLLLLPAFYGAGELLAATAPGLGTSGGQLVVYGFCISTVALYHFTFSVNSVAHRFGSRRYETSDASRNNPLLSLFTFGEGWHNNHHHYPASARQGFRWWELDISWYILRLMAAAGLVWDLRPVPERVLTEGREAVKIAVVGTGIAGMVAARRLHAEHDVTVYEAADWIGGHTNTVTVESPAGAADAGRELAIDTGFIVFNEKTYPNFCALLRELDVAWQPSVMSFSVRCERGGLEYNGTSLDGLLAQRVNALRPSFWRMVRDILRFYREAPAVLEPTAGGGGNEELTLGEFLDRGRYSRAFVEQHLIPMGAAVWSARPDRMRAFPMRFLVQFFHNHGFLQVDDRPQWLVVRGGSREYVEPLVAPFRDRIRLRTPVASVERSPSGARVRTADGGAEDYDRVVLATHADTSLRLLKDASPLEREVLSAFAYQRNEAVLHTDARVMPRKRRAWASWNYHVGDPPGDLPTVTYWMNELQGLDAAEPYLVTLNRTAEIDPARVLRSFVYHHPIYGIDSVRAQARHGEIDGGGGVHYCGAYWGYGFHEDGVKSALRVVERIGERAGARKRGSVILA